MKIICVRVVAVYFRVQRYRPPIHDTLRTTAIDTGFRKITKSVRTLVEPTFQVAVTQLSS